MDCFRTYFTHVQTCDVTRVQSATEWTASVHTLHMFFLTFGFRVFVFWVVGSSRFRVFAFGIPEAGTQISCAQIAPKPLKVPKRLKASKTLKAPKSV